VLLFFDVGGRCYAALKTKCRVKLTCSVLPGLSGWDEQLSPDRFSISGVHDSIVTKGTLARSLLLGEDVSLERLLVLNLSCAGELESLLRAGLGF